MKIYNLSLVQIISRIDDYFHENENLLSFKSLNYTTSGYVFMSCLTQFKILIFN